MRGPSICRCGCVRWRTRSPAAGSRLPARWRVGSGCRRSRSWPKPWHCTRSSNCSVRPARACTSAGCRRRPGIELVRQAKRERSAGDRRRRDPPRASDRRRHRLLRSELPARSAAAFGCATAMRSSPDWPTARSTQSVPTTRRSSVEEKLLPFGEAAPGASAPRDAAAADAQVGHRSARSPCPPRWRRSPAGAARNPRRGHRPPGGRREGRRRRSSTRRRRGGSTAGFAAQRRQEHARTRATSCRAGLCYTLVGGDVRYEAALTMRYLLAPLRAAALVLHILVGSASRSSLFRSAGRRRRAIASITGGHAGCCACAARACASAASRSATNLRAPA